MGPPSGGYRQDFGGVVRGDLMSLLRNIRSGLRSLLRKGQVDRELDEELGAYVEMAADEKMRQGMSRKEALRAVRLESGSLDATKEIVRSGGWNPSWKPAGKICATLAAPFANLPALLPSRCSLLLWESAPIRPSSVS